MEEMAMERNNGIEVGMDGMEWNKRRTDEME